MKYAIVSVYGHLAVPLNDMGVLERCHIVKQEYKDGVTTYTINPDNLDVRIVNEDQVIAEPLVPAVAPTTVSTPPAPKASGDDDVPF